MAKQRISIGRLVAAFMVGLLLAVAVKLLLHWMMPGEAARGSSTILAEQLPEETDEIDLRTALGIEPDQLAAFLQESDQRDGEQTYPLFATFRNSDGDYLADTVVKVIRKSGEEIIKIGSSGVLVLPLDKTRLTALKLVVPKGYTDFQQQSIPLGSAYHPLQKPDTSHLKYDVVWDREIQDTLRRELYRIRSTVRPPGEGTLRDQLRRKETTLHLENIPASPLTPSDIYKCRKDSVVIVASLLPDGRITKGGGFVVNSEGVVATAFHVINKPDALAQIVMAASGETYPIVEVLAARRSADVALVKTTGENLVAAPLSEGDPEGEPVTLISHPQERFYTLTQGYICRYSSSVLFGETVIRMTITAEFADGSSGAPVFNSRGEVTGLVSFTAEPGKQMVYRFATPVAEIRRLVKSPALPQ